MWRALYSLMLYALLPFVLVRLWWRGVREPDYRRWVGERFGGYATASEPSVLWVHAVSVGEARASAPLVHALRERFRDRPVLVTCATAAGRATLQQMYGDSVRTAWLPYDYPGAVRRFVEHFRPRLGVLLETEVWPNLLAACSERAVPVVLANARMSERSARRYGRWSGLAKPAFARLSVVCAQSEADAARIAGLGAPRVSVCGNLKFDVTPDPAQVAAGHAWRASVSRPVLLLASTREGEEKMLRDALAREPLQALVVVVPRHPQRFDAVATLIGAGVRRRSKGEQPGQDDRFYLGDSMGEMAFYYAAADVTIIGGSFLPLGGQNLIEACAVGTPVVFGASMYNFSEASELALAAGAALQAQDVADALRLVRALLEDSARRERMAQAGRRLCDEHRGAAQRHLAVLGEILPELRARAPG